jgi:putative ABC transport system permease protein
VYVPDVQRAFFERALAAAQALPGVETAALTSQPPIGASVVYSQRMRAEGEAGPEEPIYVTSASAGYFRALRIPLLRGRLFPPADSAAAEPVAVVSETAARMVFGSRDPLGRVVLVRDEALRVIGVASDARHDGLDGPIRPQLFRPYLQWPTPDMTILVRSSGDPLALAAPLRRVVHSLDPNQPVFGMAALETLLSDSAAERRQRALLLGAFALVSLAIAAIGVYGIMAYSVERRRHEIGIRIGLGARRSDVLVMVLGEGILLASLGITTGFALAFALTRILAGFLFGIGARDITTFAAAGGALAAAALLASCVPAMRAMSVDPIRALRQE